MAVYITKIRVAILELTPARHLVSFIAFDTWLQAAVILTGSVPKIAPAQAIRQIRCSKVIF